MTPIHLIADIYLFPVQDDARGFRIVKYGDCKVIEFEHSIQSNRRLKALSGSTELPAGNWQIICTTKEITEEVAKGIVRELPVGQRWMNYNGDYPVWWHTAKESLRSLVTSKGFNPESNYLIIKKVS